MILSYHFNCFSKSFILLAIISVLSSQYLLSQSLYFNANTGTLIPFASTINISPSYSILKSATYSILRIAFPLYLNQLCNSQRGCNSIISIELSRKYLQNLLSSREENFIQSISVFLALYFSIVVIKIFYTLFPIVIISLKVKLIVVNPTYSNDSIKIILFRSILSHISIQNMMWTIKIKLSSTYHTTFISTKCLFKQIFSYLAFSILRSVIYYFFREHFY